MALENKNDYSSPSGDTERDAAAKGGPTTSLGIPDDKHGISHPYSSDTQTQLAAASTQNKNNNKDQQSVSNINEDDENILSEDDDDIISKD